MSILPNKDRISKAVEEYAEPSILSRRKTEKDFSNGIQWYRDQIVPDIRNKLGPMYNLLQMLGNEKLSSNKKLINEEIERAKESMEYLIKNI